MRGEDNGSDFGRDLQEIARQNEEEAHQMGHG